MKLEKCCNWKEDASCTLTFNWNYNNSSLTLPSMWTLSKLYTERFLFYMSFDIMNLIGIERLRKLTRVTVKISHARCMMIINIILQCKARVQKSPTPKSACKNEVVLWMSSWEKYFVFNSTNVVLSSLILTAAIRFCWRRQVRVVLAWHHVHTEFQKNHPVNVLRYRCPQLDEAKDTSP
jgi:hypothetical protein